MENENQFQFLKHFKFTEHQNFIIVFKCVEMIIGLLIK